MNRPLATPEVKKRSIATPPSSPAMLQKRLQYDIDNALRRSSLPLLSLALLRGHCCGDDHCLYEAVRRQNLRALEFLLQRGHSTNHDVDSQCGGRRPLHLAIQACMAEGDVGYKMAELLLKHGSRPDALRDDDPAVDTPLHNATKRGCPAAVALLLCYGADPNGADMSGFTPLHVVCRQTPFHPCGTSHEEVIQLVLRHGACPSLVDHFGLEPLHYAHDVGLRQKLLQAERWWSRGFLRLARGRGQKDDESSRNLIVACCHFPEIFETIIKWL